MRAALSRGLLLGLLLVTAAAVGATAQPPALPPVGSPPAGTREKLKATTAALAADVAAAKATSDERAKLQDDLRKLIERLNAAPPPGPMDPPPAPGTKGATPKGADPKIDIASGAPDPLRAATNLVSANQIEAALNAFRQIDLTRLSPEDRAFAKYMTASCLRRLGRTGDALAVYRTVMDDNEDPFVVSSAQSQVSLIRTAEDLQAQLAKLRERPKSR